MKKIIFTFSAITMFVAQGKCQLNLHYATPQNTYVGSPVREIEDLNRRASEQYNANVISYNQVVEYLSQKSKESTNDTEKTAWLFTYFDFKVDLQTYIDGGNWQDAYYAIETAKSKIQTNYNKHLKGLSEP